MNKNTPGIWTKFWRILPWKKLLPGEALLAWGLAFLVATVALVHVVMGWILAGLTMPLAMILLALGFFRARGSAASVKPKTAGFGLLLLGTVALWVVAFQAASISYKLALHAQRPTSPVPNLEQWVLNLGSWLIPAVLVYPGLSFWTNWPPRRRRVWCVVILAVPLAALLFHLLLAALGGPLTA